MRSPLLFTSRIKIVKFWSNEFNKFVGQCSNLLTCSKKYLISLRLILSMFLPLLNCIAALTLKLCAIFSNLKLFNFSLSHFIKILPSLISNRLPFCTFVMS
ncbi:hypothetical protein [Rickettsia endosymbiont of Cantharis rufa]|uniref:hypothetical protein n=1 Tax=Rickettsia endosymbiont of Cantharis rufa TaxID=3066248 RepID=UPI0031330232